MPVTRSDWALICYKPDTSFKALYSNRSPVSFVHTSNTGSVQRLSNRTAELTALESIRIFRNVEGFCESVEITADSANKRLEIEPFDVVSIQFPDLDQTTGDERDDAFFVPVARGFATVSRSRQRRDTTNTYRLLGSTQDLSNIETPNIELPEGLDVADYLTRIVKFVRLHPSIIFHGGTSATFEPLGVTVDRRINPNSVDLAQYMGALQSYAEQAGVKVRYGVDDTGIVRFEKVSPTILRENENAVYASGQGEVRFREPSNTEHINAVRWFIGQGNTRSGLFRWPGSYSSATPDPITHLSTHKNTSLGVRTEQLSPSQDILEPISIGAALPSGRAIASFVGDTQDETFTLRRIIDSESSSYCVIQGVVESSTFPEHYFIRLRFAFQRGTPVNAIAAVSFSFKQDPSGVEPQRAYAYFHTNFMNTQGKRMGGPLFDILTQGATAVGDTTIKLLPVSSGVSGEDTLFFGDRARVKAASIIPDVLQTTDYIELVFGFHSPAGPPRIAIQDFRIHRMDTLLLDGLAIQAYKFPVQDPFDLRYFYHKPYHRRIELASQEGDTIPPTEATSMLELDAFGKTTTFVTGEPVSADVAAAQAALNKKVRAAMNNAAKSSIKKR